MPSEVGCSGRGTAHCEREGEDECCRREDSTRAARAPLRADLGHRGISWVRGEGPQGRRAEQNRDTENGPGQRPLNPYWR